MNKMDRPSEEMVLISLLVIAASIVIGLLLMNDMLDVIETYGIDRNEMPILKLLVGYFTLPFAAVCAVINIGYFYLNIKALFDKAYKAFPKRTYKFKKQ